MLIGNLETLNVESCSWTGGVNSNFSVFKLMLLSRGHLLSCGSSGV